MSPAKKQTPAKGNPGSNGEPADIAQAYRELAKGEQTATALEANLTNLESKLDAMLAALEDKAGGAEGKAQGPRENGK